MKKIVLISCVKKKLSVKIMAKDLYISALFKYKYLYAQTFNPDDIYILSAKHGLLDIEIEIEPYDVTLNNMKTREVKVWSEEVLNQLRRVADLAKDEFIFLTGDKYRKYLESNIINHKNPLEGMRFGVQLKFMKDFLNDQKL